MPSSGFDLREASFEGKSPEELSELAVRVAVLGEPNTLGLMSFMVDMRNPLADLAGVNLSEDAMSPVAEVLVIDELVGSGRAGRLTAFRLGPVRGGRRRLLLEWLPRKRYTNVEPQARSVEGDVTI